MTTHRPGLAALLQSALMATGAETGWVVGPVDGTLTVLAASGGAESGALVGHTVPSNGTAAFVMGSGQPVAMQPRPDDAQGSADAVSLLGRTATAILCVPCDYQDETVGVLCLIDKQGGGGFGFDEVEFAGVLALVGGGILAEENQITALDQARSAAELSTELLGLEAVDPARFALVAVVIDALLARS